MVSGKWFGPFRFRSIYNLRFTIYRPHTTQSDILGKNMRYWILLGLAAVLLAAIGCTSSVHTAIRDGEHGPATADTGPLHQGTTGGDAAGTLNLDVNHQGEEPKEAEGGRRRGGGGGDGA